MPMAFLWEPCADGARLLRVFGDTPCPVIPGTVAGITVTEIGPYCFAERPVTGGRLWGEGTEHPITGNFVEEVTLPDSVHTLHSAAFYNCRRLRRLTAGGGICALGSDLFTNCHALETFALRAAPGDATGLRKLLGAVSADVGAEFLGGNGARLFYPEYFELLDENAPAHLFNRNIEGEGYRYRQCFGNGAVDYAAYDAVFPQASVNEPPENLCRLALGRLLTPYALKEEAQARYEDYLRRQPDAAFGLVIRGRDSAAVSLLAALGLPTADAAVQCGRAGWSEGAALLLGGGRHRKKSYDFDF